MSGLFNLKEGKDIFYDLKKNIKVDWRKLLYFFSKRYKTVVNKNADLIRDGISCLIADDTVLLKEGTKIEFVGKIMEPCIKSKRIGF